MPEKNSSGKITHYHSDDLFRPGFRASAAALLLATPAGEVLEASRGARQLFGYTAAQERLPGLTNILLPDEALQRVLAVSATNGPVVAEVTGLRKDGTRFPVRWQSNRFTSPAGAPLLSVALTDSTGEKRVERNGRHLDYNLQLVLDNSDEALALIDRDYRLITFNKAAETAFRLLHGGPLREGDNIFDLLGPKDRERLPAYFEAIFQGEQREAQRKHEMPDGSFRVFKTVLRPLFKDGTVIGIILNSKDITKKYKAEEALREMEQRLLESNRRYELAARATSDLVYEVDVRSGSVIYNEVIRSRYGYAPGELTSLEATARLVHPDDREPLRSTLEAAEATRQSLVQVPVLRLLKKDGTMIVTELITLIIRDEEDRPLKRIGSARDISWRYAMEQELRKSKERFELAASASYDLIWERDFSIREFYYNEALGSFYGYSPEELRYPETVFARFPHPDDRPWLEQLVAEFLQGNDTHLAYPVHRLLKADGSIVYVEANALLIRNEDGSPQRMIGVSKDITERYLMEQRLRESNERYQRAAEASYDIVWEVDLRTRDVYYNEPFYELLGYGPSEIDSIDAFFDELLHPIDRDGIKSAARQFLESSETFTRFPVHRLQRKDGSFLFVEARARVSRDENGRAYRMTGVTHDVTTQRLNEMELRELNKQLKLRAAELEDINSELERSARELQASQQRITEAGIRSQEQERAMLGRELHDNINQILASCKLMTAMALREESLREQLLGRTHRQLQMAIDEIRSLSHSLVPPAFSDAGLEGALRELTEDKNLSGDARVKLTVRGDTQLLDDETALMLYRVTQEALHNTQKHARATEVRIALSVSPQRVELRVADNGSGFDPGSRKEGIGLRNIRSRVELRQGLMELETAPGAGCALRITVPLGS